MLYLVFQDDPGNYGEVKFTSIPEKISSPEYISVHLKAEMASRDSEREFANSKSHQTNLIAF